MRSRLGKRNGTSAPRLQFSFLPQNNYRSGERKRLSSSPTIPQVSFKGRVQKGIFFKHCPKKGVRCGPQMWQEKMKRVRLEPDLRTTPLSTAKHIRSSNLLRQIVEKCSYLMVIQATRPCQALVKGVSSAVLPTTRLSQYHENGPVP